MRFPVPWINRFTACIAVVLLPMLVFAQPGLEAYNRGDLDAVRSYLAKGKASKDEHDFLRAALMSDADSAFTEYQLFTTRHAHSPLWPRAMERLRQYYFAKGLYVQAEEVAKQMEAHTPVSLPQTASDTMSRSEHIPEVVEIETPSTPPAAPEPTIKASAGVYTLQIGAFSRPENVIKLKNSLEKEGYLIEVFPTMIGGKQLQAVRAVGFKTRESALAAIQKMKSQNGLNPILLPPGSEK